MRDAVLAASGALDARLFGRAIPMQRHPSGEVTTLAGRNDKRRSVYLQVLRLTPLTLMEVFDQPKMETNCSRRGESTVSLQALALLNSDAMVEAAEAVARRAARESPDNPVARAVLLLFGREIEGDEQRLFSDFLHEQSRRHLRSGMSSDTEARQRAFADLCHMLISSNEFLYID